MPVISIDYNIYRPILETFDRLEWRSQTALGWVIRQFTRQPVNHTGMVMRFPAYDACGIDVVCTAEALGRGFGVNRLSRRLAATKGYCIAYPLKAEYDHLRGRLGATALGLDGTPYDLPALAGSALGYMPTGLKLLFCSEGIFVVGRRCGLPVPERWEKKAPRPGKDMDSLGWWSETGYRLVMRSSSKLKAGS